LVPSWTKPSEKPNHFRMFNARSETVADKGVFKRLLTGGKRCIALADGFYEWKKDARGEKQPYYVHKHDGRPMMFAALYDKWHGPSEGTAGSAFAASSAATGASGDVQGHGGADADEGVLYSFTILTTSPSKDLTWLHDRMPVILRSDEDAAAWLGVDAATVQKLATESKAVGGDVVSEE
jgi:putative SOS response-associated peptidase YedK